MRHLPIVAGLMTAMLAATAPAHALEHVTPKEKAYFLNLEVRLWQAWNARLRPADAARFYSKNPHDLFFDLAPLEFKGWAQYQRVASRALAGGGHAVTHIHKDFTVIKSGDLVVTAFTFDVEFYGPRGVPHGLTGRETDVWTRRHGRWVIIHQHMSVPMRMPRTGAFAAHAAGAADHPAAHCGTRPECRNIRTVEAFYQAAINHKDFARASRYLGPTYIQHDPNAPDGPAGLKAFLAHLRAVLPRYHSRIVRAFATGHYVILQVHNWPTPGGNGVAIVDIFRLAHGRIVEHWDVHQKVPAHTANGHSMF